MSNGYTPPPVTQNLQIWAQNVVTYLQRTASRLSFKRGDARAVEDGVILWDEVNGYPVVSKNGEWRQIVLEDGQYQGAVTTDQTAASADTAYKLTYTPSVSEGIDNDATYAERIVFEEAGQYMICFSAQISAGSSSEVDFYFWPRVNGTDASGSTMVNTLKNKGARLVVSRTAIFDFSAGDYLEAMWAVSNTNGFLDATAATAFCPAAPASTIAITRLHA